VAVFALAAGIAGLGGALYAMQQQSVTATQFSMVAGLPIFLVAVVGGVASVGDGLFTGTAYVGALNLLVAVAPWSQNVVALLPALAGASLGRNPEGLVPAVRRLSVRVARRGSQAGPQAPAEPEIPVEWWGVRRAWRPDDEKVLDRGVAAG